MPKLPERYDDAGPFAKGGTAYIHVAFDPVLERRVAAKVCASPEPDDIARLRLEARVTARLDHPAVVPVYDLGDDWFTMKRVQGRTLGAVFRTEPPGIGQLELVVEALLRVCDALAYAHDRRVIHRDVKPDNIMIGELGQTYLMDWGIAVVDGVTDAPFAGSPGWMAPEQDRGLACDARADVWGVGAILYRALTGKKPEGEAAPVKPPVMVAPDAELPPELVRIAMTCLAADPARRYPDIRALAADLAGLRDGGWWFSSHRFHPDEEIVREGEPADTAWIITAGHCEVRIGGGPVAELGPGDIFGEAALVEGGVRTGTVVAITAVTARLLTRDALDRELARRGWIGILVRQLATRFVEAANDAKVRREGR